MKGLYDNEMKLEFVSRTSNEAFARITVAAFVAQLDPTIDELSDIKTAVSEAVTNSIIHGYGDEDGIVKVEAKIFKNTVEIIITDNGRGIDDVEMAMKPLYTSKGDMERSGMGFTIMESFMDEIKVESALGFGTKVILKKTIESKKETSKILNNIEDNNKLKKEDDINIDNSENLEDLTIHNSINNNWTNNEVFKNNDDM